MGTRLGTALPEAAPAPSCPRSVRPPGWPGGDGEESLLLETSSTTARACRFSQLTGVCSFLPVCIEPACGPGPCPPTGSQRPPQPRPPQQVQGPRPCFSSWSGHSDCRRLRPRTEGPGARSSNPHGCLHTWRALAQPTDPQRTEGRETVPPGSPDSVVLGPCPLRVGVGFAESRWRVLASLLGHRPPEITAQNSWGQNAPCPALGGTRGWGFRPGSCCCTPHACAALCPQSWVSRARGRLAQWLVVSWPSCPALFCLESDCGLFLPTHQAGAVCGLWLFHPPHQETGWPQPEACLLSFQRRRPHASYSPLEPLGCVSADRCSAERAVVRTRLIPLRDLQMSEHPLCGPGLSRGERSCRGGAAPGLRPHPPWAAWLGEAHLEEVLAHPASAKP